MVSSASPSSPSQNISQENHCVPSPNAETPPHVCTEIFKKSIAPTSPEPTIEPDNKEMSRNASEETADQTEEREREYLIQMIMRDEGLSRKDAEIKYDFFN